MTMREHWSPFLQPSARHQLILWDHSTSFGWGKGGNVTSAGWQVTLCDPIWYVSSRSGVGGPACKLLYAYFILLYFTTDLELMHHILYRVSFPFFTGILEGWPGRVDLEGSLHLEMCNSTKWHATPMCIVASSVFVTYELMPWVYLSSAHDK